MATAQGLTRASREARFVRAVFRCYPTLTVTQTFQKDVLERLGVDIRSVHLEPEDSSSHSSNRGNSDRSRHNSGDSISTTNTVISSMGGERSLGSSSNTDTYSSRSSVRQSNSSDIGLSNRPNSAGITTSVSSDSDSRPGSTGSSHSDPDSVVVRGRSIPVHITPSFEQSRQDKFDSWHEDNMWIFILSHYHSAEHDLREALKIQSGSDLKKKMSRLTDSWVHATLAQDKLMNFRTYVDFCRDMTKKQIRIDLYMLTNELLDSFLSHINVQMEICNDQIKAIEQRP